MIVNLGFVELGGNPLDIELDGYTFKFADSDPDPANIRTWYNVKKMTGYYENANAEVRVFINYDSPEFLAVAVKWLTLNSQYYKSIHLIFESGKIVTIK